MPVKPHRQVLKAIPQSVTIENAGVASGPEESPKPIEVFDLAAEMTADWVSAGPAQSCRDGAPICSLWNLPGARCVGWEAVTNSIWSRLKMRRQNIERKGCIQDLCDSWSSRFRSRTAQDIEEKGLFVNCPSRHSSQEPQGYWRHRCTKPQWDDEQSVRDQFCYSQLWNALVPHKGRYVTRSANPEEAALILKNDGVLYYPDSPDTEIVLVLGIDLDEAKTIGRDARSYSIDLVIKV